MAIVVVVVIFVLVGGTCLLSGVLYVWVTSLADTEVTVDNLRLSFDDGSTDLSSDGSYFATSDIILRAEQTGGDPIDWSQLTVYCEVKDSGSRKELQVESIGGSPFSYGSNSESRTGQMITFSPTSNNDFQSGDYVIITIIKGFDKVYTSVTIRIV